MDFLGFDKYWTYDKQMDIPYMWAEANVYWYRGVNIAKIKGGDLYTAPELQPNRDEKGNVILGKEKGVELIPIDIDAMNEKNKDLLNVIEDSTVKKIVREYEKYIRKIDIFEVAFSGGKDSAVLLDLVKKALPKDSFVVIFGDTGMEYPDTYEMVELTKEQCEKDGIPFYIARSYFTPEQSWKLFGPPARVLRWCCSVHKSTPQTLKLREITGKNNFKGLDYVGVRAHESIARSTYEYENFGKKVKGQHNFNPILEWTSAEIWAYIYFHNILVNSTYKKGNSRAGCLFCPMGGGMSDFFRNSSYRNEINKYIELIKETYYLKDDISRQNYVANGGWHARVNGDYLIDNEERYKEKETSNALILDIKEPRTDWKEWIKTIGDLCKKDDKFYVSFGEAFIPFNIFEKKNGYKVELPISYIKDNPKFVRLFKQVFRKAAYCGACQVCEANCHNGSIKFIDGKITVNNCIHCHLCHDIDCGCLLYRSRKPQEERMNKKNVNTFNDHAPKRDWLVSFFELKEDFFTEHTLGTAMINKFKRFLSDAELSEKNHFTPFAELISKIGWETDVALGLMLTNLVYNNPQFDWYVKNMDIDYFYDKDQIKEMLIATGLKERSANQVIYSYKLITDTPFGKGLNFGYTDGNDLVRSKCILNDNRVFLYALYKFCFKCNMDKELHVSYLYDESIERDAVSPIRIFGIYDEEELKSILLGLSSAYPDYINATFTNDLKTITLRDKTSTDILKLFKEAL